MAKPYIFFYIIYIHLVQISMILNNKGSMYAFPIAILCMSAIAKSNIYKITNKFKKQHILDFKSYILILPC